METVHRASRTLALAGGALAWMLAWAVPALALDPSKAITQYTRDAWTSETDLPQTSVQAMAQTRDGYLWLGTQEGLVRFDGVRFTQMSSEDITALCEACDGTLWVGTYNGLMGLKEGTRPVSRRGRAFPTTA